MRVRLKLLLLFALVVTLFTVQSEARCDRTPDNNPHPKTQSDGRFKIEISGSPESYVPGEQYTVFLRNMPNTLVQHKFKDFLLVAEQEAADPMREPFQKPSVGSFTLYGDTLTKFSERCPNSVMQTNSLPKTDIQVLWKAPPSGSGCVAFRATVIEQRDLWFMDDGDLTKVLCEEVTESDDIQPPVLNKCCACDEAKYEVTFEGLWSRNTHPKDFPSNGWLTRFSDVIGASHTKNYTFWNYGEYASEGLRQVAEHGNTRVLESELKAKSDHIRTIIKARGISYPNVTGKTFAVFRVDNRHHLMSLVSMIDPSPDWFVGVSSLELCQRNCSWIESKALNLYPWDAGTDDGWTYISPDQPSTPRNPIRRIKSNSPNDPRSPFYDPSGAEMKPLARLYLSRQRLYEKTCDPSVMENSDVDEMTEDNNEYENDENCQVTEWSDWSPCSATCGKGIKYRQREYTNPHSAHSCNKRLMHTAKCHGTQRRCQATTEVLGGLQPGSLILDNRPYDQDTITHESTGPVIDCEVSRWSKWSNCNVSTPCGKGYKQKYRHIKVHPMNGGKPCPKRLLKVKKCKVSCGNENNNEESQDSLSPMWGPSFVPHKIDCVMSSWSPWSPCSETCGPQSVQTRTRRILHHPSGGGYPCMHRVETRPCNLYSCPVH